MHTVSKSVMELADGTDVIVRHPDNPYEAGQWTVVGHHYVPAEEAWHIDYTTMDGGQGVFVLDRTDPKVKVADLARTEAERTEHIAGLRALADWLEANPQVPLGACNTTRVQYSVTAYRWWQDDFGAACGEVDRVAALMGRTAGLRSSTATGEPFYEIEQTFGPVCYSAVAVGPEPDPAETNIEVTQ